MSSVLHPDATDLCERGHRWKAIIHPGGVDLCWSGVPVCVGGLISQEHPSLPIGVISFEYISGFRDGWSVGVLGYGYPWVFQQRPEKVGGRRGCGGILWWGHSVVFSSTYFFLRINSSNRYWVCIFSALLRSMLRVWQLGHRGLLWDVWKNDPHWRHLTLSLIILHRLP